jgi:hypothetical protein
MLQVKQNVLRGIPAFAGMTASFQRMPIFAGMTAYVAVQVYVIPAKAGIPCKKTGDCSARNDALPTDKFDRLKLSLSIFYTVLCYNFSLFSDKRC